jgi:hypothetical protein
MANEFKVKNGLALGGSSSGKTILTALSAASGTLTFPSVTGTVITSGDTGTVTNTMLANNSITINGTSTALGGSVSVALSALSGVSLNSPVTGQLLGYNGTNWVNTSTITSITASNLTLTGTLTANSSTGTNGQFLKSTGTGVIWANPSGGALSTLSDVSITTPTSSQVLTYNGSVWVNSTPNQQVASAIFSASQYDMGYVYDSNVTVTEDEGSVTGSNTYVYDLGILSFSGIISLSNLDQSVKSDYLGYSIIFGF